VRELVTKGVVGPLDGFVSAKTRNRFAAASLRLVKDEGNRKMEGRAGFRDKVDLDTLTPFWTDPRTGAELCEAGNNFVLRTRWRRLETDVSGWAHHVSKAAGPRAGRAVDRAGQDRIDPGVYFPKGPPFDAFLKREEGRIAWEFPPRNAKTR